MRKILLEHWVRQLRRLLCAGAAALVLAVPAAAAGSAYPDHPLRLIAPIAPGGLTDTVARMVAEGLSARLGQQVIVDNRAGGAGVVGMTAAARAPADGYNLVIAYQGVASVNPVLFKDLAYDTLRDFAPVGRIATFPMALVVNAGLPASNLSEFLALARSQPGRLSYASAGNATTSHLSMELFKRQAGLDIVHIPYKGEAPALNDLLGGQVDVAFSSLASVLPHVAGGRLKVIGVASAERSALLPDVPTIAQAGVDGFQAEGWYALLAPAGSPAAAMARLSDELAAVVNDADMQKRMQALALSASPASADALKQWIVTDTERWAKVIADAGIKAE